jgi:hypothetical protein
MPKTKPIAKPQPEAAQKPLAHLIPESLTPDQERVDLVGTISNLADNVRDTAECLQNLENALWWFAPDFDRHDSIRSFAGLFAEIASRLERTSEHIEFLKPIIRYRLSQKGGGA